MSKELIFFKKYIFIFLELFHVFIEFIPLIILFGIIKSKLIFYITLIIFLIIPLHWVFFNNECISLDREIKAFKYFTGYQTGGRMVNYKDSLILTIGDFNDWTVPQNNLSIFGKILAIDLRSKKSRLLSLGHRNQQGLYLINDRKMLISTEHGPKGGDEVNIIKLADEDSKFNKNYGWPKSSYGNHYDVVPINSYTKKNAPLYKNHTKEQFYLERQGLPSEEVTIDNRIYMCKDKDDTPASCNTYGIGDPILNKYINSSAPCPKNWLEPGNSIYN